MYVLSLLFAKQNVRVCVSVVAFIVISFLSLSAGDVGWLKKYPIIYIYIYVSSITLVC